MFKSRRFKSVTNAIKTVGAADLSQGLNGKSFAIGDLSRYGVAGRAIGVAYDPVQGLMALSTDRGEIHVFGQQQVEVVLSTQFSAPIRHLRFVKGVYLVALDEKGNILVFSVYTQKLLSSYSPPGKVTAFETDPSMDWLLLGMQNGAIYSYDIDRGRMTGTRIDNLQKEVLPKERMSGVVSIQWNPRDIGSILVAYTNCAVIYSLATGEIKLSFLYELPAYAPGGDGLSSPNPRFPKLTQAVYHPNSLNIVTSHEDGSIVFWDALTGELIQARSLFDVDVNHPQKAQTSSRNPPTTKFFKLSWLCHANPDDTSLLIAGGDGPESEGIHNLTLFHFGTAPKYTITSYDKMSQFYSFPKQQRFLPIQNPSSIIDFLPLATRTPFFSGGHDPQYIFVLLDSGEVEVLSFPSGKLNYRSALFPQSIAWIHPRTTVSIATPVPKKQWLGMISRSTKNENILQGGFPTRRQLNANEVRSAMATGHVNGSVRLYDTSQNELDDSCVVEVNVASALNSITNISIDKISFAGDTAELAVATIGGDVVLYKFDINKRFNPKFPNESTDELSSKMNRLSIQAEKKLLVDLRDRTPNVKEGFLPISAIHAQKGRVSSLKNSNIGFVAIGYESGDLIILDRRGPAIIFSDNMLSNTTNQSSCFTFLEFSIMIYGDDGYSSILLFGGTDKGELFTYKILPEASGRFTAKLVEVILTNDSNTSIRNIIPYKNDSGTPALATFEQFHKLSNGLMIDASLCIVSHFDLRILTPGKSKSSHKVFNQEVLASGLSIINTKNLSKPFASVIPILLPNNSIKVLSLPELKEIQTLPLPFAIDPRHAIFSSILPNGDVLIRIDESTAKLISLIGSQSSHSHKSDKLYNEMSKIPYRPQIGTAQWIKGTTLITYQDLDTLIGGERRPISKNPETELANGNLTILQAPDGKTPLGDEDDYSYKKPVRGRTNGGYDPTRKIYRSFQNGIESVEESFNDYATNASNSMNETIGEAKNDLVKSVLRSKFGF